MDWNTVLSPPIPLHLLPSMGTSLLYLLLLVLPWLSLCTTTATEAPQVYIVYMGGRSAETSGSEYLELLSSFQPSGLKEERSVIHSYRHAFRGFSAMLTETEASMISGHPGVVSVFKDRVLPLHTTRSWDFLDEQSGLIWRRRHLRASHDVIVGIIDTGIWPESPSFGDGGVGKIPARWKGMCMEGPDFKKSHCNRKLIGARFYDSRGPIPPPSNTTYSGAIVDSPRDTVGHGTHTASTAVGVAVADASYYGLARGTARGGLSSGRLAVYKACSLGGCSSSNILKAIDDAVRDGVDILSISIGISSVFQSDFLSDPIAIGAFHATQHGVLVVCSGGNDGPDHSTVVNSAPWIVTVAASSIDRSYRADIVLGNGDVIEGSAITFSSSNSSKHSPLVFGGDIAGEYTPVYEASNCYPGSLDPEKAAGKIVVCLDTDPTVSRRVKKLVAQGTGALGLVMVDQMEKGSAFDAGTFAFSEVRPRDGARIFKYINSTRTPVATILPGKDVNKVKPAPSVAYFSSRGPGSITESILKPDIMAPGVGILASWIPTADAADIPAGFGKPSSFAIKSGTSMASPHVAGAAALIKSVHPRWTPSMIRSALMTTASTWSNVGKPLTTATAAAANIHDTGAGEISPLRALDPGLVFETTAADYLTFLCYYGYSQKQIAAVSSSANFTCPPNPAGDAAISTINYPSISVARLDPRRGPVGVRRTATSVTSSNATYTAHVEAPPGLGVKVWPERLAFAGAYAKASFEVWFDGRKARKGYGFGSVTWWDGSRRWARIVFAVNVV